MVIFMPYYRQHHQRCHSRTRPTTSNGHHTNATTATTTNNNNIPTNGCKFASKILCRITFSLFLFIIALFLFQLSINNESNQIEGSYIIASILLIIAMVTFIRTCHNIRRYHVIMDTRRRLIQRLRDRQQAYDLAVSLNNNENPANVNNDLPTYKELFPSHRNINNSANDLSLSLPPPPSYDDYITTLAIHHPITNLPISSIRSHTLSLQNSSSQSPTNPAQCIWITDQTRRPLCIRGTVTYV